MFCVGNVVNELSSDLIVIEVFGFSVVRDVNYVGVWCCC